jgi:hypothetical protein
MQVTLNFFKPARTPAMMDCVRVVKDTFLADTVRGRVEDGVYVLHIDGTPFPQEFVPEIMVDATNAIGASCIRYRIDNTTRLAGDPHHCGYAWPAEFIEYKTGGAN